MQFSDTRPMDEQIEHKLHDLEQIPVEAIAHSSPDLPGAFLQKRVGKMRDRDDDGEYGRLTEEYNKFRGEYLKGLAEHPTTRALALLAVGEEGVERMEQGRVPSQQAGTFVGRDGQDRPKYEYYNLHHIFQKSAEDLEAKNPGDEINSARNLVLICTFAHAGPFEAESEATKKDGSQNWHHYIHGAILHPQTNVEAGGELDNMYVVKPGFPIYPPCKEKFENTEEVYAALKKIDPKAVKDLPEEWAERVVAFSQAIGERPLEVPGEFQAVTRAFSAIYNSRDEQKQLVARDKCAEMGDEAARNFLPAGADVNGVILPEDHVPSRGLPVVDGKGVVTVPEGVDYSTLPVSKGEDEAVEEKSEPVLVRGYTEKGGASTHAAIINGLSEKYGLDREFLNPVKMERMEDTAQGKPCGMKTFEIPEGSIVEVKLVAEQGARPTFDYVIVEKGEVQHLTRDEVTSKFKAEAEERSKGAKAGHAKMPDGEQATEQSSLKA